MMDGTNWPPDGWHQLAPNWPQMMDGTNWPHPDQRITLDVNEQERISSLDGDFAGHVSLHFARTAAAD